METSQPFTGGKRSEAGALWSALEGLGVINTESLEPLSEALLFGVGGGIGLGYFVYESGDFTSLYLATRLVTAETPQTGFLHTICARLGVGVRQQSASSAILAEKKLQAALAAGSPVLAYVDPRRLPYPGPPAAYHAVLVFAFDSAAGTYQVIDRYSVPLTLTAEELSAARTGEGAPKFRALEVIGRSPVALEDLQEAARLGLAAGLEQQREGFGPANFRSNFGLRSLEKWAGLVTDPKDRRGWPKFFPPGLRLFDALLSAYQQIEQRGGPAALRTLYAAFIEEAGGLLGNPGLVQTASLARAAAKVWSELSAALLPQSVPLLAEARQLEERRLALFYERGRAAKQEIAQAQTSLEAVRATAAQAFPLTAGETGEFLAELRRRILEVAQAELDSVQAVDAALSAG